MNNTVQTLKYAGLAGGAVALVFSIYVVYSIWDWLYDGREYYRGRFLLTATVEVDGELKSGSSVYEVSYNAKRGSSGFGASPINGARGTMPVIDLGKDGLLLLTFEGVRPFPNKDPFKIISSKKCRVVSPSNLPTRLMTKQNVKYDSFRSRLKDVRYNKIINTTDYYYPRATLIYNESVFRSIALCDVETVTRNQIRIISLSIENTNLPLAEENPHPKIPTKYSYWQIKFLP